MQSAVAQKSTKENNNKPETKRLAEQKKDAREELGAKAGMPIFLKSIPGSMPSIGAEDDDYEREADQVAEAVMGKAGEEGSAIQTKPINGRVCQSKSAAINNKPDPGSSAANTGTKSSALKQINRSNDAGFSISPGIRKRIESSTGANLSNARVHTDNQAIRANKALNSRAFTYGNHIWLGQGESQNDVGLMAHEATHVIQQSNSTGPTSIQRQAAVDAPTNLPIASTAPASGPARQTDEPVTESSTFPGTEELDPQLPAENETEDTESGRDETEDTEAETGDGETSTNESEQQQEAGEEDAEADVGESEATIAEESNASGGGVAADGTSEATGPAVEDQQMSDLATGDIALIDFELAEHQRWGSALERVGTAESLERAEFIAEAAGGGLLGGLASGAAMGMGMGLVGRAAARFIPIPGVGGILSGAMSVYGLASRDWSASGATISQFGEGASTYETLANSIASIAEIIDIVSNILGVVEGIVGVLQIAVYAITAAAGIATVLTLGAAAPILAAAASAAETLTAISLALGIATTALDLINAGILQPAVLLFRALHAFTSEADPREVEAQGADLTQAAGAIGGAVGGAIGARGASLGGRPRGGDVDAPNARPHAEPPVSAASGDGPTVRVESPHVDADAAPSSSATTGGTRPAILPPPNPDAPVPNIPGPARVPDIQPTPDYGPERPDYVPQIDPLAPTQRPSRPAVDPLAPTERPATSRSSETASGNTPEQLDLPFPTQAPPPRGFVNPDTPELHGTHLYGQPIPAQTRAALGHNVQADHVIAQAKMRQMLGPDYDIRAQAEAPAMTPQGQLGLPGIDTPTTPTRNYQNRFRGDSSSGTSLRPQDSANWSQVEGHINTPVDPANLPPGYGIRRDSDGNIVALPRNRGTAVDAEAAPLHVDEQGMIQPGRRVSEDAPEHISHVQGSLTVLAETGRISDTEAYPHTQATFRDQQADVPEIARLREQGGPQSHSSDLVGPSVQSRQRAGYENQQAVDQAWLDQTGRAFQTRRMGDRASVPLEDVHGRPILDASGQPRMVPLVDAQGRPVESVADQLAALQRQRGEPVEDIPDVDDMNWSALDDPSQQPSATPIAPVGGEQLAFDFDATQSTPTVDTQTSSTPAISPVSSAVAETPTALATTPGTGPTAGALSPDMTNTSTPPSMSQLQAYNNATRINRMGREGEQTQAEIPGVATQVGQLFLPQLFAPEGEAPTPEQREASHRGRFASDAQAGNTMVERVNPEYPSPPGTPQQLQAIQQEIENILAARAQAETAEAKMGDQQQVLESDQAPIQQAIDGADGGISAVQAHREAVSRRTQVNQEQQQRQQETGGLVSGYPSRATGLTALTIPLDIFAGFTSLASHLPGDAGAAMAEMNHDATQIQEAFAQMAASMVSQDEAQPERQVELTSQQSRIETTDAEATTSGQSVEQSKQDSLNLQQDNEAQLTGARQARAEASEQEQLLDEAATTKQAQADTLAEQLQTWAQQHKDARGQAVEATAQQLEAEGYVVLEKSEG
jgi:hypothetical protein